MTSSYDRKGKEALLVRFSQSVEILLRLSFYSRIPLKAIFTAHILLIDNNFITSQQVSLYIPQLNVQ